MKDFDDLVGHLRQVEGVMEAMVNKIQRLESQLGITQEEGAQVASSSLDTRPRSLRQESLDKDRHASSDIDSSRMGPSDNAVMDNDTLVTRPHDPPSRRTPSNINGGRIIGPAAPALPAPTYSNYQDGDRLSTLEEAQTGAIPADTDQHASNVEAPEVSRAPSLADHHAALILEDLAFDRTNNVERQSPGESE